MAVDMGKTTEAILRQYALNRFRESQRARREWVAFYGRKPRLLTRRQKVRRWIGNRVYQVRTRLALRIAPWLDEW